MTGVSDWFEAAAASEFVQTAGAWLATYAVHSTILILGVWLVCRGMTKTSRRIGPGFENRAWRFALVGGVLTATVQLAAGVQPLLGAVQLDHQVQAEAATVATPKAGTAEPEPVIAGAHLGSELIVLRGPETEIFIHGPSPVPPSLVWTADAPALGSSGAAAVHPSTAAPEAPLWPAIVFGLWLLAAAFALARVAAALLRLRTQLQDRKTVVDDPVLEIFLELCSDAKVRRPIRLTQSSRLPSPVALWRNEIVLSTRAVETLGPAELRGVLAHEIAHIERRDPLWLCVAATIETLLVVQPLNRLARKGMQESAELLCDDWAIATTGDEMSFARSLADLAAHSLDTTLVPGMMTTERPLTRRVRRALSGEVIRTPQGAWRPGWIAACIGALALLVVAAPGVVWANAPAERSLDAMQAITLAAPPTEQAQERRSEQAHERRSERRSERDAARARREADSAGRKADRARRAADKAARKASRLERKAADARRRIRKQARDKRRQRGERGERIGHASKMPEGFIFRLEADGETILDLGQAMRKLEALEDLDDLEFDIEGLEDLEQLHELEALGGLRKLDKLDKLDGFIIRDGDGEFSIGKDKVIIRDGSEHIIIDTKNGAVDIQVDGD